MQIPESTAVDLSDPSYDVYYGWGRGNASAALRMATGLSESPPSPPPDTTPPSATITCPKSGDTVSGGVTVSVDASDNVAVSRVKLYKNGTLLAVDFDAPYEFYWDTTGDLNGVYMLVAKAYDSSGNVGVSSPLYINVVNKAKDTAPPTASITQPLNGATVSGTINVTALAWDESGISNIEFYTDDKLMATGSQYPYVYR